MKPLSTTALVLAALATSSNALNLAGLASSSFNTGGLLPALVDWFENQTPLKTQEDVSRNDNRTPLKPQSDVELRLLEFGEGKMNWHSEQEMLAFKRDGKTFIDVTDHISDYLDGSFTAMSEVSFPGKVSFEQDIKQLAENISTDNMRKNLVEFSGFHTRYYKSDYGLQSSMWLRDRVAEIASGRDDITVNTFDHAWQQKSLIAHIEGTENPDEIVVVGAHQDSINLLFPSVLAAPGADDDGSGTVTTLEIFRVLVQNGFKPKNTVEFHWYSAEEGGLLGSQDIFTDYKSEGKNVKAMLQQDMTGYSKGTLDANGNDRLGVITDYVDSGLTEFIKLVVDSYCDIPYVETLCGYGCSDHASAKKAGYPSAFVIESEFKESDPYIHTTMDTIDRLSFKHMKQHAKLTLGYAYELGNHQF